MVARVAGRVMVTVSLTLLLTLPAAFAMGAGFFFARQLFIQAFKKSPAKG